ncbi:MAG: HAMP domain-containing histidine kinase [Epsilonproteobacteria bacterium]|nr:HAMP domain-containing histidine kinase [Campylobacterota bacterium]
MNKDEKKALVGFLSIYTLSAFILMSIIAILYYNKGITSIEDQCSIEMNNASLVAEQELMKAQMNNKRYIFNPPKNSMRLGLFNTKRKEIFSNLKDADVLFSQKAYKNNKHEYHIKKLDNPILGVAYIVVENDGNKQQKIKLIAIIISTIVASILFVLLIGYLLSKILLKPIRERIEKLNRFIRDSSHEINTPVSALMMSTSSIKNLKELNPRVLNHISVSAKLISQIYNTLSFVAFNEIDEIYDEKFDLKELVEQSVRFFDEIAKSKGNSIKCSLQNTPVFLDKTRMSKVINNLLSNALKYSYPRTTVDIILKDYTLCIINEGEGINEEDQKSIFKRFERRSKSEGGFGIGLDIVQSVCNEYNIQIKVESTINEKTTFFLTFPKPR